MAPHLLLSVVCLLGLRSGDGQGTPLTGNVTGPDFLVTDWTRQLNLTCLVSDASAVSRYLWFTPGTDTKRCTELTPVCTFQPRLEDDNQNVTCRALDPTGDTLLRTDYQVNLTYPPPSPPFLTQTNTVQPGDVITCRVSGGKPSVTNVTFHCQHPDHADREDDVSDEGAVSSSVTVNTSQASNQSMLCVCSAHWDPEPGLYYETTYTEFILNFSESSPDHNDPLSPAVIGAVIGAVVVAVAIVIIAVFMWKYCRRKHIHSRQRATIGENTQTAQQQQRQRRPQQISRQQTRGQQQPHDAAAVLAGSHTTSQHADIGNPYDVLQPGQDDGRTYTELMTSSTADDGTYLHPVNDDYEIPVSR